MTFEEALENERILQNRGMTVTSECSCWSWVMRHTDSQARGGGGKVGTACGVKAVC